MAASVQSIAADASPARETFATWRAVLTFVTLTYGVSWSIWAGGWLLTGRPATFNDARMVAAV